VAFSLISCDSALSPSETSPLLDDPPLNGFWRIEGAIDAPFDWDPTEDSDLLQIWIGETTPWYEFTEGCTFNLVFTGQTYRRWHFKTRGNYTYEGDPWNVYFCPPAPWWSHPDWGDPQIRRTWVQGYKWVEWGGGWALVKFDEDWSFNPKNYADGIPWPDWKYVQPYAPGGPLYYWAWTTVYLDLTD